MISKDELKSILAENRSMVNDADLGFDDEFFLDSFGMVDLQAILEDRYGIQLDPRYADLLALSSVNRIHDYLVKHFPGQVAP
ncbi:acyl carrier protein [Micromonospora sp. WMMD723]|uniref:acyl carrier protein n=1 Tax=unclassified Micromonospora TaxID=2617518 RepID=UPI003B92D0A7